MSDTMDEESETMVVVRGRQEKHQEVRYPYPGELFRQKYRIESVVGKGGFGKVFRAQQIDTQPPRRVAIKILSRSAVASHIQDDELDEHIQRFEREGRMVALLTCPSTISLYDYGQTEDGTLFMVLEYAEGTTLTEFMRKVGPLPCEKVVAILRQILMSLAEAHANGIVHRDIKPENIMVDEREDELVVKVLDFGVAKPKRAGLGRTDLTVKGAVVGTPRYMAPEHFRGEEVGAAGDIYSLGLVAWEMLVGKRAIEGDDQFSVIANQLSPRSAQIPDHLELSESLRHAINGMLRKSLHERTSSADAVLLELHEPDKTKINSSICSKIIENCDDGPTLRIVYMRR